MGKRQTRWAQKRRDELLEKLGGVCVQCGKDEKLEFDCICPVDENSSHSHRLAWDQRMRFYTKQFENKNLQLLCNVCHGKKTRLENQQAFLRLHSKTASSDEAVQDENIPF